MDNTVIETSRLILRPMEAGDFAKLYEIFSDAETMKYYPAPFDKERVKSWITWNLTNYKSYGYGLWALILKAENQVIGDCGLIHQVVDDVRELEIAYHVHRNYWGLGYATEGVIAVKDYGFTKVGRSKLISLIRPENLSSCRVAEKNGMIVEKDIMKFDNRHSVYVCHKENK